MNELGIIIDLSHSGFNTTIETIKLSKDPVIFSHANAQEITFNPRNKSDEDSLLQLLDKQFDTKIYPIHRLDRKTSGIILMAKKTEFVSQFQELFTNKEIQKTYVALVRGFAPAEIVIDSPVKGRDADVYKDFSVSFEALFQLIAPQIAICALFVSVLSP